MKIFPLFGSRYIGSVKITSDIVKCAHKELIFRNRDKDFLQCHAGTIAVSDKGEVVTAWFGGDREKAPNVMIWYSIKGKNGWSLPCKFGDPWEGVAHWNPVFFYSENILRLFYKYGPVIPTWKTVVSKSDNFGATWSEPVLLDEKDPIDRGPVKNKPIRLSNGWICAPTSQEKDVQSPKKQYWDAFVDLSYDNGESWERSSLVPIEHEKLNRKGIIQPTLWESTPGNVHMLLRSTEGKIYRSDSSDFGKTWCKAYATHIPNNNSGIDLVKLASGELALIYNRSGVNRVRTPLNVALSKDNGKTFKDIAILETSKGEFSYPSIVADGDGNLHMIYTYNRESMAYCKITLKDDK